MNDEERELLWSITEQLSAMLRGETGHGVATIASDTMEIKALAEASNRLITSFNEVRPFIMALAEGNLNVEPPSRNQLIAPYKQLHASLRHLTWQTQQIASGDLNQRVDFLGEFSVAFNKMIAALREKRRTEEELRFVSIHDALTGVYNRTYFTEEMVRLDRSRHFPVSLVVADLDGLKEINDTRGHAAGDRLIQRAAQALQRGVRAEDVVARIGGDEFAVILPDTDEEAAAKVVLRIREHERAANREKGELPFALSLGGATAPEHGPLEETLRQADIRMYEEKNLRKLNGDLRPATGPDE